jgi:WD40 repeat protein
MEEQGKDQLHHQHQQLGEHHGQHDGHGHHEHSMLELRPIANPLGSGSNSASELRGEKRTAAHDPEALDDTGTSNSALVTLPSVKRRRVDADECSGSMNRMETSSDSEVSEFGSRAGMVEVPSASGRIMVASTSSSKAMAVPTTTTLPGMTTRSGSTLSVPLPSPRPARRKPWKHVYCERLMVERNWRKGRPVERILKGHTNGVMCLQVQHNLSTPSYPVLITGSYDKTIKVWNLDTGEVVRTLLGHTRSVRALQFDQAMLVTGSSDKTLRVWNWRTGECLRVLEGHTQGVSCLHYDRNTLASGSADSTIKVSCRSGFEFRQSVSVADNR